MLELKLVDGDAFALPDEPKKAAKIIARAFATSGRVPGEDVSLDWTDFANKFLLNKDVISTTELRPLMQVITQEAIREPLMPPPVITGLFNKIKGNGMQLNVIHGAIGSACYADDIGEGGTYPEGNIQVGGGMQVSAVGKSGIQVSFTEEAIKYCSWDIMGKNLGFMKDALVRHKETKAALLLRSLGTELFNNTVPSTSLFGTATGRGLGMTANGSVTADDIFRGASHMGEEGFWPDIMIVHPQTAFMWQQDPVLRHLFLLGGGDTWQNMWQGEVGPTDPWSNGSLGIAGMSPGNAITPVGAVSGGTPTGIAGREWGMNSTPVMPSYFGMPMRIIASPFIPYDVETGLTDIFLASSGNIGLLLQEQEPIQSSWMKEENDVVVTKMRENYAFYVGNQGQSIGLIKNVPARARNFWTGTVEAQTMAVTSELDQAVAVPGL